MFANEQHVENISIEQLRHFMDEHKEDEFLLVDVRETEEYEVEHIPGAELLPLSEIVQGTAELKPAAHTIFYQARLIQSLEEAEEGHARQLYSMLRKITSEPLPPFEELYEQLEGLVLESGEPLVKAVSWLAQLRQDHATILEVAVDLELKAYDLYRSLANKAEHPELKEALLDLSAQERRHAHLVLKGLAALAADRPTS